MTNQQKLLDALKKKNYDDFEELLYCDDIDVNYFYGERDNGTLLDLANRSNDAEFITLLIEAGATIWYIDEKTGKLVIHEIFKNLDGCIASSIWNSLQGLSKTSDIASSIMQTAVAENDIEAMELLARSYSVTYMNDLDLNQPHLHLELLQGSIEAVKVFIKFFDVDNGFQTDPQGCFCSCRIIILQKYPELESELPKESSSNLPGILFSYLHGGVPELFLNQVDQLSTEVLNNTRDKNKMTYLHVACVHNHLEVMNVLLKRKIQLNEVVKRYDILNWKHEKITPIMMAARGGHYEMFVKLFNIPEVKLQIERQGSVLHAVIHGMRDLQLNQTVPSDTPDGHGKILAKLCSVIGKASSRRSNRLNIEHTDENNMTALNYAIKFNNEFALKELLRAGAKFHLNDEEGKSSLTSMSATIIESYFDECIESNAKYASFLPNDDTYLRFYCGIFQQTVQRAVAGSDMEFFTQIESIPELKKLFKHPLSKSFLFVKWCQVEKYYYIHLVFVLLFCVILNVYIFQIKDCLFSSVISDSNRLTNTTLHYDDDEALSISCGGSWWLTLQWWLIILFVAMMHFRETCKLFGAGGLSFELQFNLLGFIVVLVVVVFLVIFKTNAELAAVVILTSWIEFIFLLGKYPVFSIYIEMFITVALNFARFFALYLILVASFAYSFYILFRNKSEGHTLRENETNSNNVTYGTYGNSINSWQNPIVSLIKTIIMMTGEFDASSLPLGSNLNFSYVFFIIFVFLISMVLNNLLNGLAVGDTRAITEDVELIALISRAKLILELELLALVIGNPIQYCCSWYGLFSCRKSNPLETDVEQIHNKIYSEKITLFNKMNRTGRVYIDKNQKNQIFLLNGTIIGRMPSIIVKQIEQILEKQSQSFAKNTQQREIRKQPLEKEPVDKLVHELGEKIHRMKLETNIKLTKIDAQITEVDVKVAEIDEKIISKIDEKIAELDEKIAERDKKLLITVDKRINELTESVEQVLVHLKQKLS